jgi:hypothetical protein
MPTTKNRQFGMFSIKIANKTDKNSQIETLVRYMVGFKRQRVE